MATSADERVTRMLQQASPLPAGPSHKKPLTILLSFHDQTYYTTLFTLLQQIGQGNVYGVDQPIHFILYFPDSQAMIIKDLTYLGSGLAIPHTIQIITDASNNETTPRYHKVDIAILASNDASFFQTEAQYIATPQIIKQVFDPTKELLHLQPGTSNHIDNLPNIPSKVLLLTAHDISITCTLFQQTSKLPSNTIQGFVLHHSTFLLSSIIDKLNYTINQTRQSTTYPYITLTGCQNMAILSSKSTTNSSIASTTQQSIQYDLTHAVLTDYPTVGRITPLVAIVKAILPDFPLVAKFTPVLDAKSMSQPLCPLPGLLSKHLHMWSISSPKSTFFPSCVGIQIGHNVEFFVAPIATYYSNSSILSPFKEQFI